VLDITESFIACARSDRPDGLFATVVVDEVHALHISHAQPLSSSRYKIQVGKALGLVYSSKESLQEAIRTRQGVYYSRSRHAC
jgi:phosphoribosyl-ATP pyrophosphohydrolase/phosphoribosyl-AMP cyclohydrolase/histidinol dehydrogenase